MSLNRWQRTNARASQGERLVVVVPVRGLRGSKTRLRDFFDEQERVALTAAMLRHVLSAVRDAALADRIAVVTPDPAVVSALSSPPQGIEVVRQPERQNGLNSALLIGRGWAAGLGADAMLVLSADLPLLRPEHVRALVAQEAPVIIATDRHGTGTNGLLLREPLAEAFTFSFGEQSALRHVAEADRLGLNVVRVETPGTAFDLDTPDDWASLPHDVQHSLLPARRGVMETTSCP
ncbi:MAG: 2-phospho-L-lactate guanylyltransferase [Chloroflexota bacterium]|nr:2-phospho-L-lactate guanylyltransferase [Chloroflexota bacterium]